MIQKPIKPITEGQPVTIVCETDGANPVAHIQFYRKRAGGTWEELTNAPSTGIGIASEARPAEYNGQIRKSTLTVKASEEDNQATFKCEVKKGSFEVKDTTVVTVYCKCGR